LLETTKEGNTKIPRCCPALSLDSEGIGPLRGPQGAKKEIFFLFRPLQRQRKTPQLLLKNK
jgi:hypothetical protein